MLVKEEKYGPYSLHTIKTDRFKTCHIEIIFRNNVNVHELTLRNVLFDYLIESSKNYKTNRELQIKLESLYNASLYTSTSKVGASIITNLCLDILSPKYSEEKIVADAISLLFDLINNPLCNNKEFDKNSLEYLKNRFRDEFNSIIENPRKLSIINAFKTLGDTPTSYQTLGCIEDLEKITPSNLYNYYEKILSDDYIDIYVIGSLDMDKASNLIKKYNKFKVIKNHEVNYYVKEEKRKLITNYDNSSYFQTNLVCLLNLNSLTDYEKKYVANFYNILLGGGSLQTKLSKKLRVENSLCYNVQSSYIKYDNLIMISTGIDQNQEQKALKLIKEAIKEMGDNITDEEMNEARELILTSLKMIEDNPGRIIDNEFYINLGLIDNLEERIEKFKNITKEDIYNVSKKINLSNVYSLRGGINEEN